MAFTGEAIALATVFCWTFSIQFFAAASREVGAIPVNIIRLSVALLLFSILLFFKDGILFPIDFPVRSWLFLSLSGVIGFFIGDIFFTVTGKWKDVKLALTNRKAVAFTAIGAAIGPFLGVSLSLLALHYLTTGVASTFFSLIPICIIPFSIYLHKEHVSLRAFGGAVTAVFGVYLLMS